MKTFLSALPALLRDVCGMAGAIMIAWGTAQIYRPAGIVVGGLMLVTGAILLGRGSD